MRGPFLKESYFLHSLVHITNIIRMSVQGHFHILLGITGCGLVIYAVLVASGIMPIPYLIPPHDDKDRRKERRFYTIGYGGLGVMAVLEMLDYYTTWSWVLSLAACVRIVLIIYLLCALIAKPYVPGYYPGDTLDRQPKGKPETD